VSHVMAKRKSTKRIMLGDVAIGGGAPITVQSMTNTDTADVEATLAQLSEMRCAGCDIGRVAVPDGSAAEALPRIIAGTDMPVVADVHFDHKLALAAIQMGAAGIRINPGTIGSRLHLKDIAKQAAGRGVVLRVGVNSGSLERRLLGPEGRAEAAALAESAMEGAALLEGFGVEQIKISVKASDVPRTIEAYRIVSEKCGWPLHVGVTEAGTLWAGTIKSAVGIGALLAAGIGDTIRVSLTASPVEEVRVGRRILAALDLGPHGPEVISCPTCARAEIDVIELACKVEEALEAYRVPLRVAVMGCAVNGPGEAREADIGITGGKGGALLFVEGEMVRRVSTESMLDELIAEVQRLIERRGGEGEGR